MKRVLIRAILPLSAMLAVAGISTSSASADAGRVKSAERSQSFMRVYGQAAPPYGYVHFCQRMPAECLGGPIAEARFVATPERLAELDDVNRVVNAAIEPATDMELYGVEEYWTLPVTKGDCEDYALLKRHILIKRGWPVGSLLMTVVKDDKGEGHAILTARTAQGDFILDNKVATVQPWHRSGYEFIMRQSYINPNVWMSLDPKEAQSPMALSGVKSKRTSGGVAP